MLQILTGDCRTTLRSIEAESVQCCVASPPYWGLRDYHCDGQIGAERTYQEYVDSMVAVFAGVWRALKPDGTLWLNLGDSYAGSWGAQPRPCAPHDPALSALSANQVMAAQARASGTGSTARTPGLKPKDLVGIPWRVAFALQAAGWYLRRDVIWGKPNGMPESVEDRPCSAHEYVFMFTKNERYFYDYEAVRLPALPSSVARLEQHIEMQMGPERANAGGKTNGPMKAVSRKPDKQRGHSRRHAGFNDHWDAMEKQQQQQHGAALRSVWWISPAQSKDGHFAVMPVKLAATCILASSRTGDTVLDPFGGSGTTAVAALELGRRAILCELNPAYVQIAGRRTSTTLGLPL